MTEDQGATEPVLARRGLMRAGAVAAAVTAGTAAASVLSTPKAEAAAGDTVKVGGSFSSNSQTKLSLLGSTSTAPLALVNPTGPSLYLAPINQEPAETLPVGYLANTDLGPLIGLLDDEGVAFTSTLATGADIAQLAVPTPIAPTRMLDTRSASGRSQILASSSSAFDSSGRLKGGAYLDLAVLQADQPDFSFTAAFLNITVTGPLGAGYVSVYPPGPRPSASTLNYVEGQTIANGIFVALGVNGDAFAVRIYSFATTHVIVDLTGAALTMLPGPAAPAAAVKAARARPTRTRAAARFTRSMGPARRR